jgi:hypothetical protein
VAKRRGGNMSTEADQIEWQKMIVEIQTSSRLKYGCRLSNWEIARLYEWSKLKHLSDAQGAIVEKIYQEKME